MMSRMSTLCLLVLLLFFVGCFSSEDSAGDSASHSEPVEVPDTDLSYRNEPLLDDSGTPETPFDAPDPGDSPLVERAFENAPPVIPHNLDDLLPITGSENACLDCHLPEDAADVGATPVPASHLYDIRRDRQLDTLNPANYNCMLCHAPQADTGNLVDNTFEPYYRAKEQKEKSNLLEILNEGVK